MFVELDKATYTTRLNEDVNGTKAMNSLTYDTGWDGGVLSELSRAIKEEIATNTVARKFIPIIQTASNTTNVSAGTWLSTIDEKGQPRPATVDQTTTIPLVEIYAEFSLTREQVLAEVRDRNAVSMVRKAARDLVTAEDAIIFSGWGPSCGNSYLPAFRSVKVVGHQTVEGLLSQTHASKQDPCETAKVYLRDTIQAIAEIVPRLLEIRSYRPEISDQQFSEKFNKYFSFLKSNNNSDKADNNNINDIPMLLTQALSGKARQKLSIKPDPDDFFIHFISALDKVLDDSYSPPDIHVDKEQNHLNHALLWIRKIDAIISSIPNLKQILSQGISKDEIGEIQRAIDHLKANAKFLDRVDSKSSLDHGVLSGVKRGLRSFADAIIEWKRFRNLLRACDGQYRLLEDIDIKKRTRTRKLRASIHPMRDSSHNNGTPKGQPIENKDDYETSTPYPNGGLEGIPQPVEPGNIEEGSWYGRNTVRALEHGAHILETAGTHPPFALILRPEDLSELNVRFTRGNVRETPRESLPSDIINIYSSRSLREKTGIMMAMGGAPADLFMANENYELTLFTIDSSGQYIFRLRHKFAIRLKHRDAVFKLKFVATDIVPAEITQY